MGRVRHEDTKPEMVARCLINGAGYRYRLHDKRLPGKPDLVFKRRKKVIFVYGCFWYRHEDCPLGKLPQVSTRFLVAQAGSKQGTRQKEQGAAQRYGGIERMVM